MNRADIEKLSRELAPAWFWDGNPDRDDDWELIAEVIRKTYLAGANAGLNAVRARLDVVAGDLTEQFGIEVQS